MGRGYVVQEKFYKARHLKTVYAAETISSLVIEVLSRVNSAIDFGCGVGTWLSVIKEKGSEKVKGLDGVRVNKDLLEIGEKEFQIVDFERLTQIDEIYDLVISLEVAEHVSKESVEKYIDSLVSSSEYILFSAAIPLQGGRGMLMNSGRNIRLISLMLEAIQ